MFIEYFCNRIGVFYYSNEFIAVITTYADDPVKQTTHYAALRISRCGTLAMRSALSVPLSCVEGTFSYSRD